MSALSELLGEADRQFTICNACRYCEDYCPVFPAMEQRSLFAEGDLGHLANLCHDCRACYQACMYTEPHEFAINIPALMAEARTASYKQYARPRWLSGAFDRGPATLGALTALATLLCVGLFLALGSSERMFDRRTGPGALYDTVGHLAMAVPALLLTAYAMVVVVAGTLAFWRDTGGTWRGLMDVPGWRRAGRAAATLAGMRGAGAGCFFPEEERPTDTRRHMHALVVYGFLLTFAATVAAFFSEQVFDRQPPYPVFSAPVLLGIVGGVSATIGSVGLLRLRRTAGVHLTTAQAAALSVAFLWSLLAVSVSGLLLLLLRDTGLMTIALLVHLGTVLTFYLTVPYGKMVHGFYRLAALLRAEQDATR